MSKADYSAWRVRLAAVFAVRLACAGAVIWLWDDLDSLQKAVAIAVVAVVVPKLTSVRRLLVPYERYVAEGLPE
jgi:hypothetical protein